MSWYEKSAEYEERGQIMSDIYDRVIREAKQADKQRNISNAEKQERTRQELALWLQVPDEDVYYVESLLRVRGLPNVSFGISYNLKKGLWRLYSPAFSPAVWVNTLADVGDAVLHTQHYLESK